MWLHHGGNNRLLEADRGSGLWEKLFSEKIHLSVYSVVVFHTYL